MSLFSRVDWRDASIQRDASLKEALSRMLALGYRSLPVVDPHGKLLGHITLTGIERTMEGGDAHLANHGDPEAVMAEGGE